MMVGHKFFNFHVAEYRDIREVRWETSILLDGPTCKPLGNQLDWRDGHSRIPGLFVEGNIACLAHSTT